jgi:hypothetical protein
LTDRNKQKHDEHNFTMFVAIHTYIHPYTLKIMHSLLYEKFVEKRKIQHWEEKNIVSL